MFCAPCGCFPVVALGLSIPATLPLVRAVLPLRGCCPLSVLGRLFLLFTAVPLLELWLLMHVSAVVGLPATIAMVLSTGMLGATLPGGSLRLARP